MRTLGIQLDISLIVLAGVIRAHSTTVYTVYYMYVYSCSSVYTHYTEVHTCMYCKSSEPLHIGSIRSTTTKNIQNKIAWCVYFRIAVLYTVRLETKYYGKCRTSVLILQIVTDCVKGRWL